MVSENGAQKTTGIELYGLPRASFIAQFTSLTGRLKSPEIFRLWSAIACVAGALERRVWTTTEVGPVYPNIYTILIGPSGSGKTLPIQEVRLLWARSNEFNVAPDSVTKAGLMDQLADDKSQKIVNHMNPPLIYHSCLVASTEFGNLVTAHDTEFLNVLNNIYDNPPIISERTRKAGEELLIEKPTITILGGTQPSYLGHTFPDIAWRMGFTSRLTMIYWPTAPRRKVFSTGVKQPPVSLNPVLRDHVRRMSQMHGEYDWEPEAAAAIEEWNDEGLKPVPQHYRLQTYNSRRLITAIKLSIIIAAAESSEFLIKAQHFQSAKTILLEAEDLMPEVFKEMSAHSAADSMEHAFHVAMQLYMKNNKPVPEQTIAYALSRQVPAREISWTIDAMVRTGMFEIAGAVRIEGQRQFIPVKLENPEDLY